MEKQNGINSSQLKWIAAAAMLLDHVGNLYRDEIYQMLRMTFGVPREWLICAYGLVFFLGRIAFPLFAFQVAEGIGYTRSPGRYLGRLLAFGLLSEIPFRYMVRVMSGYRSPSLATNVMFTLFMAVLACVSYRRLLRKGMPQFLCLLPGLVLAVLAEQLDMDYGALGVLLVVLLYLAGTARQKLYILFVWILVIYALPLFDPAAYQNFSLPWFLAYLLYTLYAMLSLLLIRSYNGQKGRGAKYFFYFFYPAHLWILMWLGSL